MSYICSNEALSRGFDALQFASGQYGFHKRQFTPTEQLQGVPNKILAKLCHSINRNVLSY